MANSMINNNFEKGTHEHLHRVYGIDGSYHNLISTITSKQFHHIDYAIDDLTAESKGLINPSILHKSKWSINNDRQEKECR